MCVVRSERVEKLRTLGVWDQCFKIVLGGRGKNIF